MIVQPKNVFSFDLDPCKGETPRMLMIALTLAVFDLADSLDADLPEILTSEQAERYVLEGNRGISMGIIAGRFCLAHLLATSISPTSVEMTLDMYDRDPVTLMKRTDLRMTQLVRAAAVAAIESLEDVSDFIVESVDTESEPLRAIA
jgi:hypothetical protein